MRALLVQAATPPTYWSYQHSLPFIRKKATLPPLGLATLAAHLPVSWELRLRDLHLAPLADEDLRWADAVLVSGMLVQASSMHEVLARARALGKTTVAGGPAPTTSPEAFPEATHVFQGEAEGRLERLVLALERPGSVAERVLSPAGAERPDLAQARVPRFDLVDLDAYSTFAIQVSRGCPFTCEFCDIIEVFGRVPRVKSPAQVVAELEALRRLGARGPLFLVDDNFIGNRRAAAKVLEAISAWQREAGRPFDLLTEASIDLAGEPELLRAMVEAGFTAVFVGIESPSAASLREAGKRQNLRMDAAEAVRTLTRAGLEVFAGFIVGFDHDDPSIFERQAEFIGALPIPRAMVGMLLALPGTALWRRLEREGRLGSSASGDPRRGLPAPPRRALLGGELLPPLRSPPRDRADRVDGAPPRLGCDAAPRGVAARDPRPAAQVVLAPRRAGAPPRRRRGSAQGGDARDPRRAPHPLHAGGRAAPARRPPRDGRGRSARHSPAARTCGVASSGGGGSSRAGRHSRFLRLSSSE